MADVEFVRFKKLLKSRGYFVTTPRMRLFGLLQKHPALTFDELSSLEENHDLVTLYRNIDLFEKLEIIHKVRLGWSTRIELTDTFHDHHHHVICTNCGKTVDIIESTRMTRHINELAAQKGFQASSHELEIQGLCNTCQSKSKGIS